MEIDGTYELDINPKTVCRLCLSQPADLLNIYSSTIVDGYILSIPQILQYTVDIAVSDFCCTHKNKVAGPPGNLGAQS